MPRQFVVLKRPQDDLDQLLIPDNPRANDYAERVAEAIVHLAEKERRDPAHVLNALLFPPSDVIRFNVAGYDASRGDLSFNEANRMLNGIRRSILSAACSVIKPQPFHPRLERREADQLVKGCRLRQTEFGSFTFVLACPLDAVEAPRGSSDEVPFSRRATDLFIRSVAYISSAAEDDAAPRHLEEARGGLSANLCEGLLEMQPEDERATLSIGVEWEWRYGHPTDLGDLRPIRLHRGHFDFVAKLGQELRPRPEQQRPAGHYCRVEALHGAYENGAMQGEVVLALLSEEETLRNVHAELPPAYYAVAVDAHKANQLVWCNGILLRGRRSHNLSSVTEFRPAR
ncbi:hypothetical protein [Polyangium spumosum]|uniref:Uncharacterized protein n=1 Tax=Polyangium spumosum TaxID=889282 RepID=A0A6N7Q3Z4_9BACT|nr:hypothetical protein [Polyangium spumosum]MRG98427.1 hypothetical protein [Polyangium spumosum]